MGLLRGKGSREIAGPGNPLALMLDFAPPAGPALVNPPGQPGERYTLGVGRDKAVAAERRAGAAETGAIFVDDQL